MLKVALIGIGEQGWDNILPSLAQIPSISTVATCDIDKQKSDLAARKYGAKSYYDYNTLFEKEKLDAVIVASFPEVHYEVAKISISKGISVFVEKPPTYTTHELEELIELASKQERLVTGVGLNFNYAEALNIVDEFCRKEDFGKIKYISVSHYGNKPKSPIWNLDSVVKSFLLAQAIHPIGLLTKYGKLVKSSDIKTFKNGSDLFVSGNFLLENEKGEQVIGSLTTGNMSPHFMWRIELITDKSMVVRINSLWELEVYDGNKTTKIIDSPKRWKDVYTPSPLSNGYARTGYYHQFNEFFNCIESGRCFSSSFKDLLPVYQILDTLELELTNQDENIREQIYQYNQG